VVKRYWFLLWLLAAVLCVTGCVWASNADSGRWHDPMRPQQELAATAVSSAVEDKLHLEATVIGAQRSSAVIDGTTVVVGDIFKGYQVKKITKDGVVLSSSRGQIKLSLQSDRALQLQVHASKNIHGVD